ncbi:hypothetical protein ACFQ0I_06895 [Mariniflexile aquimaris]|uniref:Lipoprotein n=1 Tax=Mariniflexile aquimaris TaxID=881009 RepID=A0ABW3BRT0_9FLAO
MKKGTLILGNFISFAIFATIILLAFTSCREEKAKTETVIIENRLKLLKLKKTKERHLKLMVMVLSFQLKTERKKQK